MAKVCFPLAVQCILEGATFKHTNIKQPMQATNSEELPRFKTR